MSRLKNKGELELMFLVFLSVFHEKHLVELLTFRACATKAYIAGVPFLPSRWNAPWTYTCVRLVFQIYAIHRVWLHYPKVHFMRLFF